MNKEIYFLGQEEVERLQAGIEWNAGGTQKTYTSLLKYVLDYPQQTKKFISSFICTSESVVSASQQLVVVHKLDGEPTPTSPLDEYYVTIVSLLMLAACYEEENFVKSNIKEVQPENDDVTKVERRIEEVQSSSDDTSSSDREKEKSMLKRKVNKYRKRSKELADEFASQRRAFLELELKYDELKLQLAQVKETEDERQAEADQHILQKDLELLNLAHDNDVLSSSVKRRTIERNDALQRIEALENAIKDRDAKLEVLSRENNSNAKALEKTTKQLEFQRKRVVDLTYERTSLKTRLVGVTEQRDVARSLLHDVAGADSPQLDEKRNMNPTSRQLTRRAWTRFPLRTRRKSEEFKVAPVEISS